MNPDDCLDPSLPKKQSCKDPAHAAMIAINEIMINHHSSDGWRNLLVSKHLDNANNYLGKGNVHYAIAELAMILAKIS